MNKFINNVELQGVVGVCKETKVNDQYVYNISLCTEAGYSGKDGYVISTTWHQVRYWSNESLGELKGKWIHIKGYLNVQKYVGSDGSDKTFHYVNAKDLEVLGKEKYN